MVEAALITIVGYVAGFFTSIASIPQIIHAIKTKEVDSLSLHTLLFFWLGAIVWTVYGILLNQWPIIIVNVIVFFGQGSLIVLKLKHGKKA